MSDTVISALIGAIAAFLASALPFLIQAGLFNIRKKTIRCFGHAQIAQQINHENILGDSKAREEAKYDQNISEGRLEVGKNRAVFRCRIKFTRPGRNQTAADLIARGHVLGNRIYLLYEARDSNTNEVWKGAMSLLVGGIGPIEGVFMAESFSNPQFLNLGTIVLERD